MSGVIPIFRPRETGLFLHALTLPWLALAGLGRDPAGWRWSSGRGGAALLALAAQVAARWFAARRWEGGPRDLLLLPTGAVASNGAPLGVAATFRVAFAGPLANAVLGMVFAAASRWAWLGGQTGLGVFFRDAGRVNLGLAMLHLLPSFPMAAGLVFRAAVAPWGGAGAVIRAAAAGRTLGILIAAAAELYGHPWLVYLGAFAALAAAAECRSAGRLLPSGIFFSREPFGTEGIEVSPPPYARSAWRERARALQRTAFALFDEMYERWRG